MISNLSRPDVSSPTANNLTSSPLRREKTTLLRDYKYEVNSIAILIKMGYHTTTMKNGFTHISITAFVSVNHRGYYAKTDPARLALGSGMGPVLDGLQVLDIEA